MAAISSFTHNAMLKLLSGHTTSSGQLNHENPSFFVINYITNYIRIIAQMAAILYFVHNAMSKVLFDYITM